MKLSYFAFLILLLFASPIWSQKWERMGHKQFQEMAYSDAIKSFEKAVEKGTSNLQIYTKLADAYYFNANYQGSAKWYQVIFKKGKNISAVHYFRYAQSLKSIGENEKAETIFTDMKSKFPDKNTDFYNIEKGFSTNKINNSGRYKIKITSFNSSVADFVPSYFGSQLVFASARDTGSVFKRNHSWTNQSFTDLYVVNPDSINENPEQFSKSINSKFNESTAVFTKNGLTMYFTRNNFENKKRGFDENQSTLLKIYKAEKKDEKWVVIGALPFCNDSFNVAHPALSPDEKRLYFASDMPGGFGQSDLYQVEINSDGAFGTPENLGATINTFGRETFPFVSAKNEFYFASDGWDGFGGLDVFVAHTPDNFSFSLPQNLGEPLNSRMDDFGFIINTASKKGFFTSNRSGGKGMDDIYAFEEKTELPCDIKLYGTIVLQTKEKNQEAVEVVLLDTDSNLITIKQVDTNGNYSFNIDCKQTYKIKTHLKGFVSQEIAVNAKPYSKLNLPEIILEKTPFPFQIGDDLAQKLALLPIYFDLGKYAIRKDAASELEKIKKVLLEYPTMHIEIRSHTDSRDTFKNNKILSNNRAQFTLNWLVQNGIEMSRLSGIGFGESQLINGCIDNVPCSEVEHQSNRRSEFIVTKI